MNPKLLVLVSSLACATGTEASRRLPRQALVDCLERSTQVKTLSLIYTQVINGGHDDGPDSMIYFELQNPSIGVDAQCSAHGPTLAPNEIGNTLYDPTKWYNCFVESRDPSIGAVFQFDSARKLLSVNETWSCQNETSGEV